MNRSTSKTWSSSCQCTTTLNGKQTETQNNVNTIHRQLRIMLENSLAVIGLSWGLDQKKSGVEPTLTNQMDHGIEWQKKWWQISLDLVIQCFVLPVPWREENYEAKKGERSQYTSMVTIKTSSCFSAQCFFANQLSIYGAIADLCDEVPKGVRGPGKPAEPDHLEKVEILTNLSIAENSSNAQQRRNLVQEYERKFEQLSEDQKLSKLCSDAGLKLVERGQYFYTLETEEGQEMQHLCREYTMPRNEKETRVIGWIRKNTRIGPVLNITVCYRDEQYSVEVQVPSLFQDDTVSWVRIVNGVDRYVTESMPTTKEEDTASVKPIAKTITRLLRHDQSAPRGIDGAIHCSDIQEECRKQKFDDASQWLLEDWIPKLAKGGRAKKRLQYCVSPNSSNQFLYPRAIQRHSRESAVDPALWDNILLPKGFTEYLHHVGNANELNSMNRNGLIPGGTSLKRGTTLNPMEDVCGMGETPCDLTKWRIAPNKNTWKRLQKTVFWCKMKLAQEKGLQFYQTRSHAVVLCDTLPAACIEKAVCMKTTDELYQKVRFTPRVPRVVPKSNSQYGPQNPQNQDARTSWEPSSDSKRFGEICNNTVDHRRCAVPLSAVEQQNTTHENKAKRLIEKFENHKHKESFIQDLRQTENINKISKESQDLIAVTNNTEIFELCENSSKQQCPDCNAYWKWE